MEEVKFLDLSFYLKNHLECYQASFKNMKPPNIYELNNYKQKYCQFNVKPISVSKLIEEIDYRRSRRCEDGQSF